MGNDKAGTWPKSVCGHQPGAVRPPPSQGLCLRQVSSPSHRVSGIGFLQATDVPSDHPIKACTVKMGLSRSVLTARTKAPARGPTGNEDRGLKALSQSPTLGLAENGCRRGAFQALRQRQILGRGALGLDPFPHPTKAPACALRRRTDLYTGPGEASQTRAHMVVSYPADRQPSGRGPFQPSELMARY